MLDIFNTASRRFQQPTFHHYNHLTPKPNVTESAMGASDAVRLYQSVSVTTPNTRNYYYVLKLVCL